MEIYLQQDDARSGPYSMEQVRIWYRDGLLPADSKAWFDGCADWLPVEEIPGIDEGSSVHMVDISTVPPFEAYQGEEPYVFASYAHKDAALVYPELTQLNDAGFNVWYDEGVDASSEWPEEIAKAVIGCAVFIVFVSPRATQSVNCRNEINLALNKSKPFLAIYLEETELPPGLELRMGDLQAILRYKLPVDRYQKKTHDSLNLLLGKKPAQSRTRPPIAQQAEAVHEPETISAPVVEPSPTDQVDVGKASPNTRRKSLIVALTSVFLIACGTLGFVFLGDEGKGEQETPTPDSISVRIFTPGESWTVPTGSIEMLWCEPGTFTMGSPTSETGRMSDETEHNVTLTKGFYLGKYEVTQAQYEAVMTGNPNGLNAKPSEWPNNPNRPVEKVSWDDAQVFLTRLNAQQAANLPAGWSYVLPTESQWEYACRAGTTTASSWGATIASPNANYNWDGAYNTGSDFKQTRDVGQYAPNPWGFFDMHGNVWEWTADRYQSAYPTGNPVTDPTGPASGSPRVGRGGSWYGDGSYLRSAERSSTAPGLRHYSLGFRLSLRQNGFTENADSNMVVFKDANLKAEILKALGKADGELTADDLLSLKSLQIYPRVVHDLSGLEKASNLEVLQFGCQAKDLSPLASLTNLKVLHLAGTEISSLEVFSGLKNLEALSFRSCVIKDRSPLEGLPNLKVLSFEYVEILNFAPFSKLHSLEELRHNNSNVSNISDVRNLTNLKFLGVQTDATCDLSPVGFLKNLEVLHVKGARKNLGVLSKLPKIQRLVFSTTDFTDSSPLRELAGIDLKQMDLVLGNCGITDFSPLHELKIGSLQISHNPISKEQESMLRKALPDCRIVIARSSVSSPEEVHFKDANLIAAIRKALNKPEGEILEGDLLALNKLSIWEAPVSDISGLEKALNLEQLGFSHGSARGIKDFSPLAQLPEFRELYFDGASVSDLKAFSELKNLEVLSVQNTEVSDISSLRGLANLKRLDIVPTAVCDLSPLQSLQNLESLVLTGSPNELEVFTKLSKLSRLYLSKCGLVDIGPLAKLDQSLVRSLSLTNNQITDFRPLHKLKLKELFIDENPISEEQKTMLRKALPDTAIRHGGVYWQTSKEVIFKDEKLEEAVRKALNKPEGKLTREDLASMDNLKVIRHGISDVTGLEHAVNLTNLVLDWNPIGDLSPLASLTKLTSISLRSVPSGDLTPLAGLKNLKELYFGRTRLQDIAPLSGLSNLEHLSLHDTSVHDITPLAKLTKLKKVEFRLSNVKDYSVLAGLTNLESVATNRGLISDEQLTTLQRALPNCKFEITKR